MDWVHEFVPGQVRASCSICGCSRRFPDNLTYCVDKLFRCERCMEKTAMELDMQIQSYRMQPDEVSQSVGLQPQGELPSTFLADAAEYRASVIPGWTPSSQFYDDFAIVPGGVGSSWTTALSGPGTVTAPEAGVARLTSPLGGFCRMNVLSMVVPDPHNGYGFISFRALANTTGPMAGGTTAAGGSNNLTVGKNSTAVLSRWWLALFTSGQSARETIPLEHDTTNFHVFKIWWKGTGAAFAAVDDSPIVSTAVAAIAAFDRFPSLTCNATGYLDVTDYVCWT
jgi:hypothetical protein